MACLTASLSLAAAFQVHRAVPYFLSPPDVQPHSARVMAAVAIANLDGLRARSVPPQLRVAAICMSLMSLLNTATAVEGYMALARTLNRFRVKGLGTRNPKSMPLYAASARTLHRRQAEPLATKK